MSYKINPRLQYRSGCDSIVVNNDIFSDNVAEESGTLTALSFRLRRYDENEYTTVATTVSSPSTAVTWGTINTSDLISYRYYPTTTTPGAAITYTLLITFTDATTLSPSFTSSSSTWQEVMEGLLVDIDAVTTVNGAYDSSLNSLFMSDGTKTIESISISLDNSDSAIEEPSIIDGDTFISDVYVVEVTYTVDAVEDTRDYYLPLYCSEKSCVLTLVSRIPELINCSSCNDDCVQYIITAHGLMKSLEYKEISNTEDISDAQDIISSLTDICDNKDCQCYE